MRVTLVLLLVAAGTLSAAPVPKEFRKPQPTLEGTWELTTIQFGDGVYPRKGVFWTFTKDTFQVTGSQPGPTVVDDSASPKQLRLRRDDPQVSVFDLNGDDLVIATASREGERLADTGPGAGVWRCTLRRVTGK